MHKMNGYLLQFCKWLIIVMIPVMVAVIFVQVILRYVFASSLSWAEELARYLLISISCFGSALAVKQGEHISLVFIKNRIPEKVRPLALLTTHFLLIGFFGFGAVQGFKLSIAQWIEKTSALQLPMTFPTITIPVAFTIMIFFSVELLFSDIGEMITSRKTEKEIP
jgi:TRAP-type C4-dicarboxylate transport system permease small subunit